MKPFKATHDMLDPPGLTWQTKALLQTLKTKGLEVQKLLALWDDVFPMLGAMKMEVKLWKTAAQSTKQFILTFSCLIGTLQQVQANAGSLCHNK